MLVTFRDRDDSRSKSRERERHSNNPLLAETYENSLKLHVGNLPLSTSEEDLQQQFQKFGNIENVKLMRTNATGQPLREFLYAFVQMSNEEDAKHALEVINYNAGKGSDEDRYQRRRDERSPQKGESRRRRESDYFEKSRQKSSNSGQGSILLNLIQNKLDTSKTHVADNLMKILKLPPNQLSQLTTTMENNILTGYTVFVRELWFGNLPGDLAERKFKSILETYGEVENIESYQKLAGNFAFVKFKKVSQAAKATERAEDIRLLLDCPALKVAFADHLRRKNVVGDSVDCENNEELSSIIYLGFAPGTTVASEFAICDLFSRYGDVININVQYPIDSKMKPFALIEMGSLQQAKVARDKILLADSDREKRKKLGDKNLEIAILIKPRTAQHKSTHLHKPSHQLEVAHSYPFRPIEDSLHQQYYSQNDNFGSPDFGGNPKNGPRFEKSPRNFRNNEQQENMPPNAMIESPFGKPNKEQYFGSGVSSFVESSGDKKTDNNKKASHLRLLDTLQTIFSTTPAKESKKKDQKESIRVKIEEVSPGDDSNLDIIWSGFITKSKQNRVGVDALLIEGDESILKDYFNLNISHRTLFEEITNKQPSTMVLLRSANDTHVQLFNDYLKYFSDKNRVGVVTLKKHILYILPPCEEAFKIRKFAQDELLGIFVENRDPLKGSTDSKY